MTIGAAGSIAIYDIDPYLCDPYVIRTRDLKYQDPKDPPHMRSTLNEYEGSGVDRYLWNWSPFMWFVCDLYMRP